MSVQREVRVLNSADELFRAAAEEFVALAVQFAQQRGRFSVALSGGSTPKSLYSLLATEYRASIPWDRVCFFLGDERDVPPDHPESNYRMANEAMLSKIPARPENIFRIHTEDSTADAAALAYEQTVQRFFGLKPGEWPRFDLVLLGLGPDGHTASLFPGSAALNEQKRLVVANWVEKFKTYRITFTYPVLNHASCVTFLVSGQDKASILQEVLENPKANLPSQKVKLVDGKLLWLVDEPAASLLSQAA